VAALQSGDATDCSCAGRRMACPVTWNYELSKGPSLGKGILYVEFSLEWTVGRSGATLNAMGQAERLTCPKCGAHLILALPPTGEGPRRLQCFVCDALDPMKTDKAMGWLKGELHPPR